jgi:hypothetical protein
MLQTNILNCWHELGFTRKELKSKQRENENIHVASQINAGFK